MRLPWNHVLEAIGHGDRTGMDWAYQDKKGTSRSAEARELAPYWGSRRKGKGRRKVGRKKRRMRSKIRHRKK